MNVNVTHFHWVRHAPVKSMAEGRIYGQRDVGCNLKDVDRLRKTAAFLPEDAIWVTSTLSRTKKTAKALAEQVGWQVRPLAYKELMEQSFGLWQSKTWDELDEEPDASLFWDDPAGMCPPDGESFTTVCKRVSNCVNHLVRKYPAQHVICVTHAGTIRAALAQALDLSPTVALRLKVDTLSVSTISHIQDGTRGDTWEVGGVNLL